MCCYGTFLTTDCKHLFRRPHGRSIHKDGYKNNYDELIFYEIIFNPHLTFPNHYHSLVCLSKAFVFIKSKIFSLPKNQMKEVNIYYIMQTGNFQMKEINIYCMLFRLGISKKKIFLEAVNFHFLFFYSGLNSLCDKV